MLIMSTDLTVLKHTHTQTVEEGVDIGTKSKFESKQLVCKQNFGELYSVIKDEDGIKANATSKQR